MSWIKKIDYEESDGKLRKIYDRIKGPDNYIDNILKVHGLRPHTLVGHMALYKNVLHNKGNSFPIHFLEGIGVYVSLLNKCDYCVEHHFQGMSMRIKNNTKAVEIMEALKADNPRKVYSGKAAHLMDYAKKLTLTPSDIVESDIDFLRMHNIDDGEILEVNQVVSYFNYANRTVLGLGVNTKSDILGMSPSDLDDDNNWSHR